MMALPNAELFRPRTVREALLLLAEDPGASRPVAGGTDLLPAMKLGLVAPARLVDVTGIPRLNQLHVAEGGGLVVGAAIRLADLVAFPDVALCRPALREAALAVGSPQLRHMGTVGGNLCLTTRCRFYNQSPLWRESRGPCFKTGGDRCHAVPRSPRCHAVLSADTPPAFFVLGAQVHIVHLVGEREVEAMVPVTDLHGEDGRASRLPKGALVTGVSVPAPSPGYRTGYAKYRLRHSIDFPLAGVAVGLRVEDGVVREARIVLGAMAPCLVVAEEAAASLDGREPSATALTEAAALAARQARPVGNLDSSAGQRRQVLEVLTRRLLTKLAAGGET